MPRIEASTVAEHHAMRRGQVLDAAVEVLAQGGPGALTPAAVASRTGLARSSVYQYYPSTAELLAAALEAMLRRSADRVRSAVAGAGEDRASQVSAYVRAAIESDQQGHGVVDLGAVDMPERCRQAVTALHDELMAPLRAAAGDDTTVALVLGVVDGASRAVTRGAPMTATADAAVAFALRGLGLPADG